MEELEKERELDEKRRAEAYRSRMQVDPEMSSRDEARAEDLHLQLSEKYMVYKDLAERTMLNPQHLGKNALLIVTAP